MSEQFPNLERPSLQDAIANVEELFKYYRHYGSEEAAMLAVATVLEENLTMIGNHIEDLQRE